MKIIGQATLEGTKTCAMCGKPATVWRTNRMPILPLCMKCWTDNLYRDKTKEQANVIPQTPPEKP